MADPTKKDYAARELAEVYRLAQERFGVKVAAVALEEWEAVNLVKPQMGNWFTRLLGSALSRRKQARRLAETYYNLARALGTGYAWDNPDGESYGHTVHLSSLFQQFEDIVNEVAEGTAPLSPPTTEPSESGGEGNPSNSDSRFVSGTDAPTQAEQKRAAYEDQVQTFRDDLRKALEGLREQFPNEVVDVEPDEWPDEDFGDDVFEKEFRDYVAEELDELDKRIAQLERDIQAKQEQGHNYVEVRREIQEMGDATASKVASASLGGTANAGRDVVNEVITKDGRVVKWMRVTGPHPCSFCATLASRGAVYHTEDTAIAYVHDNCMCSAVPVFSQTPGYSKRDLYFINSWKDLFPKGGPYPTVKPGLKSDQLNVWRRWLNEQYRKGLVPDQDVYGPPRAA